MNPEIFTNPEENNGEPQLISPEAALEMLDMLEIANNELLQRIEQIESTRPLIIDDEEAIKNYEIATFQIESNVELIEQLRRSIAEGVR